MAKTTVNVGIKRCDTCDSNIRCTECVYPLNNKELIKTIDHLNAEKKQLKIELQKLEKENTLTAKSLYRSGVKDFAARLRGYYLADKRYSRVNAHTLICFLIGKIDSIEEELAGAE